MTIYSVHFQVFYDDELVSQGEELFSSQLKQKQYENLIMASAKTLNLEGSVSIRTFTKEVD